MMEFAAVCFLSLIMFFLVSLLGYMIFFMVKNGTLYGVFDN
jgi:hypothetical protein